MVRDNYSVSYERTPDSYNYSTEDGTSVTALDSLIGMISQKLLVKTEKTIVDI